MCVCANFTMYSLLYTSHTAPCCSSSSSSSSSSTTNEAIYTTLSFAASSHLTLLHMLQLLLLYTEEIQQHVASHTCLIDPEVDFSVYA
jgi:hypothetical protein